MSIVCPKICSGILILVSAITIGIIEHNKDLDYIRDERNIRFDSVKKLIVLSLATAGWLIVLNIIVLTWEVVYTTVPLISPRFSFLQRFSVVLMIMVSYTHALELKFSVCQAIHNRSTAKSSSF